MIELVLTPNLLRNGDILINADDEFMVVSSVRGERAYADSYAVTLSKDGDGFDVANWIRANQLLHVRRPVTV